MIRKDNKNGKINEKSLTGNPQLSFFLPQIRLLQG